MDNENGVCDGVGRVPFRFADCGESYFDNDGDDGQSSEDELDIILHGTPEQKRKLSRSLSRGSLQLSSSDDEFEKEMEVELAATMKNHEKQFTVNASVDRRSAGSERVQTSVQGTREALPSTSAAAMGPSSAQKFYDDVYFDSDEDEEEDSTKPLTADRRVKDGERKKKEAKKHHRIPSNDELLYDPNIDSDNQAWMDKQRAHYYPRRGSNRPQGQGSSAPEASQQNTDQASQREGGRDATIQPTLPKTDAILNCPACMTTLCIDCQRHELYTNQYRAMFVMNCCIVRSEQLRYPVSAKKRRRWRKRRRHGEGEEKQDEEEGTGSDELYNPVKCSICNTEVAVLDKSDVFHFFNVLSSAA